MNKSLIFTALCNLYLLTGLSILDPIWNAPSLTSLWLVLVGRLFNMLFAVRLWIFSDISLGHSHWWSALPKQLWSNQSWFKFWFLLMELLWQGFSSFLYWKILLHFKMIFGNYLFVYQLIIFSFFIVLYLFILHSWNVSYFPSIPNLDLLT